MPFLFCFPHLAGCFHSFSSEMISFLVAGSNLVPFLITAPACLKSSTYTSKSSGSLPPIPACGQNSFVLFGQVHHHKLSCAHCDCGSTLTFVSAIFKYKSDPNLTASCNYHFFLSIFRLSSWVYPLMIYIFIYLIVSFPCHSWCCSLLLSPSW